MAIGIGTATLIGAGIGAAGNAGSSIAAGKINKKSRNFQREMFQKTNEYNAPTAQMQRLREAGLNPNLIYGGSSGGAAGTASQPSKPDFNVPDVGAVGGSVQRGVMDYYQAKAIQSQTDVNEARTEQIEQDTVNKGIKAVQDTIKNAGYAIDVKTKNRLYDTTVQTAEQRLANLGIAGTFQSNQDKRAQMITDRTVAKLKQETQNLSEEGKIKAVEAQLAKQGLFKQDNMWFRIMGQTLNALGIDINESMKKAKF